jgi:hypothetical protein
MKIQGSPFHLFLTLFIRHTTYISALIHRNCIGDSLFYLRGSQKIRYPTYIRSLSYLHSKNRFAILPIKIRYPTYIRSLFYLRTHQVNL